MLAKWFDRKFNFNHEGNEYQSIYRRLAATPSNLEKAIAGIPERTLIEKPDSKWSIKEHIGHLSALEPLWRARILDIRANSPMLTATDLDNTATSTAGFNDYDIHHLIARFTRERNETIALLDSMEPASIPYKSMHPRMQQQMGIIDHLYFVAEHDDHHIEHIQTILKKIYQK